MGYVFLPVGIPGIPGQLAGTVSISVIILYIKFI